MTRNYNDEARNHPEHQYAYQFDYLMHEYMLRTFEPYLVAGKTLELGCFEGNFTRLLAQRFDHVEVVDASSDCIASAARNAGERVSFHHSRFEDFAPASSYDNIFLIHTLEHLDDPVSTLKRILQWLSPGGRLFVATPNAHAASRQIAVGMGLITHASAVTAAEAAHGHRITYSLDTLRAALREAQASPVAQGGVMFKGLANFQIDAALASGLISREYLDGCHQLGQVYPDLCASIYFVCENPERAGAAT
ncbi:class I SAM-dependent methyltransferase [Burkholderia gladioli]|uniref:class I SAM-dependent methyltransferase n=1 Tax=Burkholderia gladioli TaxID=28095 RepID=UPI003F7A263C